MHSIASTTRIVAGKTEERARRATCYATAHSDSLPVQQGQVVTSKLIGKDVRQTHIRPADEYARAAKGIAKARKHRAKGKRTRMTRHVQDARTRINRLCRVSNLRFMYTLTTREQTADLKEFDRLLQLLAESLKRAGVHPWLLSRERTQAGHWHAHLAVDRMYDRNVLIRLWRKAAGEGYVHPPTKGETQRYSWRRVARYLGKALHLLPSEAKRFIFASKLGVDQQKTRTSTRLSAWDAFVRETQGVNLGQLSRFYVAGESIGFEFHEKGKPPTLDHITAMGQLGRWALHVARSSWRARTRLAGKRGQDAVDAVRVR